MLPKIDELVATCSASHPDIVCLVETWLVDILNSEVFIPNYSVVRVDRNRCGGGVLVYVHSSITYNVLLCGHANLELIVVSLLRNNFKLCQAFSINPHPPHLLFL